MKDLLTSGKVGNIELNAQKKIREDIQKRWERIGLVEGLEGHVKETVATLYENQARHLIYEATSADNSGSFETVVFPLIRRVFSKLLANDLVSVQAMNLPIGKLFFIKPVTSERKWDLQYGTQQNPTSYITGGTGEHYGLMGYERQNRTQNGAQDNRYYLPDECVNSVSEVDQYNFKGELVYVDTNLYRTTDSSVVLTAGANLTLTEGTDANGNKILTIGGSDAGTNAGVYSYVGKGVVKPLVTQYMKKTLYDLFYDDFLFDNSKGKITITVGTIDSFVTLNSMGQTVEITPSAGTPLPVNANDNSLSSIMMEVSGFHNFNKGRLTGPDGNEMDTESFLASLKIIAKVAITDATNTGYSTFEAGESLPFRVVTQKYGNQIVHYDDICTGDGKILLEVDLTKPCKKQGMTVNGYIGVNPALAQSLVPATNFQVAWASYDSLELETEMGEVSFQLSSVTVAVEERKLRATWSPELAQDVSAFHNIDAEAELTAILSEQIAAEVDREILRDLRKAAAWQARWDYNGWQRLGTTSTVYTQKDWNQTLMTKINQLSAQIQKATLRGGANIAVVSAEVSAVLNDLEYFHVSDASAESLEYNMGIEKIGSLQGRYQVIVDPYAPHWSIILAHHGTSLLDTGYIYAPYIPMALTPTMYSPFNFAPVKGISTRYSKKLVNNRYFAHLRCDGLVHWNVNELR
jgi:hypothetical protein